MDFEDKVIEFFKKHGKKTIFIATLYTVIYFIASLLLKHTTHGKIFIPVYLIFIACFCHIKKDPYFNIGDTIWLGLIISTLFMIALPILLIFNI